MKSVDEEDRTASTQTFLTVLSSTTLFIFTGEVCMKIIAEGSRPIQYFINDEGYFNSFDCLVVVLSWVLLGQGGGSTSSRPGSSSTPTASWGSSL